MRETIIEAHELIKREFIQNQTFPTELKWANLKGKVELLYFISTEELVNSDELLAEIINTRNIINAAEGETYFTK